MSSLLDVVLVNPGSRTQIYQALGSSLTAIEPPVWAGLMATYLRRKGCSVVIIDAEAEELTPDQVALCVEELRPRLTAVIVYGHQPSASTQNMRAAGATCTAVKQRLPETPVILVGGHVAALPERTLREEAADFVCTGEGPVTLIELFQALQSASPALDAVHGLGYRDGDAIRLTEPSTLVRDLDHEMPGIAWDLLPMRRYRAHNWHAFDGLKRQPYAALYTTLGCPYHCSFCLKKGTLVITAQGRNRKIEELQVGDKVMAWDEQAQKLSETTIVATGNRWVEKLLRIKMRTGETIEISHEHPVYTSRGWIEAGDLQDGDDIFVMDGHDEARAGQLVESCRGAHVSGEQQWNACFTEKMATIGNCPQFVVIESIEEIDGPFQVFNFECAPHDNYFAEFLLVHNCCIQAPFKSGEKLLGYKESVNSYRFWSPQAVIAELDLLVKEYGVRNVKIADEMFVLNPKHILTLCDLIIERGYDLNFWAYARVDTVREEMVDKLKRAGFNWLAFGIEAANERVRTDVQKGFTQEDIFRTLARVRAAGINVIGNYIFGLPEDTLQSMQETLDLALELNCEFANMYSAMAYPGSQLYELALRERWPLPSQWSGYSQHALDTLPLPTKHLPAAEVLRFRDYAFQVYFRSPRYLEMVAQKFGPDTVAHIREMLAHKLVRKHVPSDDQFDALTTQTTKGAR